MKKLRAAVIGVGRLGRYHAAKYAARPDVDLVAVADPTEANAREVAARHGCRAVRDFRELLPDVDLVSIAVPTELHCQVASACLEAGVHVLVEKPITRTVEEADALIALAKERRLRLAVGHVERYNPAFIAMREALARPFFIESERLAEFQPRVTDIDVVLDLMIHDIDLVQSLAGSDIISIDAVGTPVFSGEIDFANARLRFANGCVANITASRVSMKTERKLRIFEDAAYISLDLQQKILTLIRKRDTAPAPGQLPVSIEEANLEQGDALKSEIEAFLDCIRNDRRPIVSGEDGLRALETAIRITEQVHANLGATRKTA